MRGSLAGLFVYTYYKNILNLGLDIIPYLRASYKWSSLFVSMSSGFFLSSGIEGSWAVRFVQVSKKTSLGSSVNSSICSLRCISFLPATRLPLLLSDGRQRQPRLIICSASDGPVSPRLCQSELSKTPYLIFPSQSLIVDGLPRGSGASPVV